MQIHHNTVGKKGHIFPIKNIAKLLFSNKKITPIVLLQLALNGLLKPFTMKSSEGLSDNRKKQVQNSKTYVYYYTVYDADYGQEAYDNQRLNCGRRPKWEDFDAFIDWADDKMVDDKWSPDAIIGFAKQHNLFDPDLIPSTTTLYNWIDCGIMRTKNMDLLEKLTQKPTKKQRSAKKNKRILGTSIEERPEEVESRNCFGHWEIDTDIGEKSQDGAVLLTLVERITSFEILLKLPGKTSKLVCLAMPQLRERYSRLFKTVMADNGSEFALLQASLQEMVTAYFANPFASYERETSENQHKLIRRFLPKGQKISEMSNQQVLRIQQWMNH